MAGYVDRGISLAERVGAAAVVVAIDTPGGLDTAMRSVVQRIMAAQVPVITFVAPTGARAASAGAFIVLAGNVAAMAPSTAIGAAHPVGSGGEDLQGALAAKVTNDAAAYMRGIAEQRGRNADWAERAVRESVSVAAGEAVQLNVVDLLAADLPALLQAADGRVVTVNGAPLRLTTAGAAVVTVEPTPVEALFAWLADANVAYVLLLLAMVALFVELTHPGAILPGVVGVLSLVLALFGFGALPISATGVVLLALGLALLLAEVWVVSGGVLGLGGTAAVVLGGLLLMNNSAPAALEVNRWLVLGAGLATAVPVVLLARSVAHLRHLKPAAEGVAALVGQTATVRTDLEPTGTVTLGGEIWQARLEGTAAAPIGAPVIVTGSEGFLLNVRLAD